MLLPSLAPKPSAGPLCLEGFQQVSVFFLLLLTKVPAGWEISVRQRQPSPTGQILPLQTSAGKGSLSWAGLWGCC